MSDRHSEHSGYAQHDHEHGHGHVKPKRYAKVLIVMECLWYMYSYNFRYLLGYKGSFYTGFQVESWVFFTNIGIFVASLLAVILAVITDSYFQKYTALVAGFLLSMISSFILFGVAIFKAGQYEKTLNAIGLIWGLLFITVEPVRVAVFFDQLPNQMDPHTCAHVFLMYQEMKTIGSLLYIVLDFTLGGSVYGKTPLPLAIIYFTIPILYMLVILAYWKVSNPGDSTYSIGIDCVTCFARALYLIFFKRVKQEGHWLDTARDGYDAKTVRTTKIFCSLIFVFTTLISYGMVQTLIKHNWNDQSQNLIENPALKYYYQDTSMVFFGLTAALLPLLEYIVLPQIYKRREHGKPFTELQRIGITVFVTGAAFVSTTILQLQIEKHSSIFPSGSRSQVRIFNVQNDSVWVSGNWVFEPTNISATNMIQAWNLKSHVTSLYTIDVKSEPNSTGFASINFTSFMATAQGESISYMIGENELLRVHGFDPIVFGPEGTNKMDMVRVYFINYKVLDSGKYIPLLHAGDKLRFRNIDKNPVRCTYKYKAEFSKTIVIPKAFNRKIFQLCPGEYEIECPPQRDDGSTFGSCVPNGKVKIERGAIYAVLPLKKETPIPGALGPNDVEQFQEFKIYTVCNPAYYSIYLMLPQIFLQAFAIAIGKIPINVFMFKESPREMRASTLALYYFSQDGSSIIFAIFNDVFRFRVDSFQLVLVTGIHMVFCFFFTFAALKHQKFPEDDGMRRRRALIGSG